jgi:hypothetical protein
LPAEAKNSMTIARQEIFGPVGTIIAFDSEEEAVAIANDSDYALAAIPPGAPRVHSLTADGKEPRETWSDDGAVHDVRSLERRAATATRPVPIPSQFVHLLRFSARTSNGSAWRRTADCSGTRPATTWTHLRMALRGHGRGSMFWLYYGADPAECARRAGQSRVTT